MSISQITTKNAERHPIYNRNVYPEGRHNYDTVNNADTVQKRDPDACIELHVHVPLTPSTWELYKRQVVLVRRWGLKRISLIS